MANRFYFANRNPRDPYDLKFYAVKKCTSTEEAANVLFDNLLEGCYQCGTVNNTNELGILLFGMTHRLEHIPKIELGSLREHFESKAQEYKNGTHKSSPDLCVVNTTTVYPITPSRQGFDRHRELFINRINGGG